MGGTGDGSVTGQATGSDLVRDEKSAERGGIRRACAD